MQYLDIKAQKLKRMEQNIGLSANPTLQRTTIKQGDSVLIIIIITFICILPIPRELKIFSFYKIKVTSILIKAQFSNSQLFLDPTF